MSPLTDPPARDPSGPLPAVRDLRVLQPDGALPDSPVPLLVLDPTSFDGERIAALERHAALGGVVAVLHPPADAAWCDLVGADRSAALHDVEVVVEGTDDPLARNIPTQAVGRGLVTPLVPRAGTRTVLRTRVHLQQRAALSVRSVGEGAIAGIATDLAPPGRAGPDDPVGLVLDRLRRRVGLPPRSMGVGIIGYGQHGGMGWLHGSAATAVAGLRLAGVAEVHPGRLADAAARFPDAAGHDRVDALLADDGVDVVVVATPPSTHHDLARAALRAGRHVVVEKPLCFTAAEADELLAVAAEHDRLLTVHQNRRWDADHRAIRRLVAEGHLGEVFNVETFVGGFEHPCTLWHSDVGVSGGRLYDWGAHLIDQTLQLLGGPADPGGAAVPVEVQAVGHARVWHDVTNLDQVRVRMRFPDGRESEFLDSDVLAVRRPKYVVQGTRGTVVGHYAPVVEERVTADDGYRRTEHHHAEGPARLQLAAHHAGWGLQTIEVPGLPAPSHPFHRALADHLQLGDPVPVDPLGVRTTTAVLEAAHASAHGGGRAVQPR